MSETTTKSGWPLFVARKAAFCLLFILIPLTFSVRESSALSTPWKLYYDYLYYTVGKIPGVIVQGPDDATGTWTIDVVVEDQKKREALATLLRDHPIREEEPPYNVTIRVVDGNGVVQDPIVIIGTLMEKLAELKNLVLDAFKQNPDFFRVESVYDPMIPGSTGVYIIFKPSIVQFYTDNISDFYTRSTYVLTDLFWVVLRDEISDTDIKPSTKEFHSP